MKSIIQYIILSQNDEKTENIISKLHSENILEQNISVIKIDLEGKTLSFYKQAIEDTYKNHSFDYAVIINDDVILETDFKYRDTITKTITENSSSWSFIEANNIIKETGVSFHKEKDADNLYTNHKSIVGQFFIINMEYKNLLSAIDITVDSREYLHKLANESSKNNVDYYLSHTISVKIDLSTIGKHTFSKVYIPLLDPNEWTIEDENIADKNTVDKTEKSNHYFIFNFNTSERANIHYASLLKSGVAERNIFIVDNGSHKESPHKNTRIFIDQNKFLPSAMRLALTWAQENNPADYYTCFGLSILPLEEIHDYKERIMDSIDTIENEYGKKWTMINGAYICDELKDSPIHADTLFDENKSHNITANPLHSQMCMIIFNGYTLKKMQNHKIGIYEEKFLRGWGMDYDMFLWGSQNGLPWFNVNNLTYTWEVNVSHKNNTATETQTEYHTFASEEFMTTMEKKYGYLWAEELESYRANNKPRGYIERSSNFHGSQESSHLKRYSLRNKMDDLAEKLGGINSETDTLDNKTNLIGTKTDTIGTKTDTINNKVDTIDTKLDLLRQQQQGFYKRLAEKNKEILFLITLLIVTNIILLIKI